MWTYIAGCMLHFFPFDSCIEPAVAERWLKGCSTPVYIPACGSLPHSLCSFSFSSFFFILNAWRSRAQPNKSALKDPGFRYRMLCGQFKMPPQPVSSGSPPPVEPGFGEGLIPLLPFYVHTLTPPPPTHTHTHTHTHAQLVPTKVVVVVVVVELMVLVVEREKLCIFRPVFVLLWIRSKGFVSLCGSTKLILYNMGGQHRFRSVSRTVFHQVYLYT